MYEEKRFSIDWKKVILRALFLVALIIILMIMWPKKDLTALGNQIFNNNLQTMKKAATSYYTVDRLPIKIGDSYTMTLGEMEENKMVIPFTDNKDRVCSKTASYVKVTKTAENEYVYKIQLACDDQVDYILETFGCYDVCQGDTCEKKVAKITEYEFKKAINKDNTKYSCPDGYSLNKNFCYKKLTSEPINATVSESADRTIVTNARRTNGDSYRVYADNIETRGETTYSCPTGFTNTNNGCYRTVAATASTTYSCPSGYASQGSGSSMRCTRTSTSTSTACPQGYTKSLLGTTCYRTISPTASTTYSCPSGYTQVSGTGSNMRCAKTTSASTTYSCPSNATKSSGTGSSLKCWYETNATNSASYGNWTLYRTSKTTTPQQQYTNDTEKKVYTGTTSEYACDGCYTKITYYNYSIYRRSASNNYSCASGTLSGSVCRHYLTAVKKTTSGSTVYASPVSSTSYSCSQGTKILGSCYIYANLITTGASSTVQIAPTATTNYHCAQGTRVGTNCNIRTDYIVNTAPSTYRCPEGYTASGSGHDMTCYQTRQTDGNYYCSQANQTLRGTRCYETVAGQKNYSCPDGYSLTGTRCYKTTTDKIAATANKTTATSYEYKWATNKTLAGYEATGKTRQVDLKDAKTVTETAATKEVVEDKKVTVDKKVTIDKDEKDTTTVENSQTELTVYDYIIYGVIIIGLLILAYAAYNIIRYKKYENE